ncbi:MAG: crossover junction endodeoxyribonuclease RuvC [Caldisericia bacterium]|nr:crossover junction endodeoxyribonuclease RuvC [Caldisericia bacterium]
MRILAVDPGLARVGWAVLDSQGRSIKLVECGLIETPAGGDVPHRLCIIHEKLTEVAKAHQAQQMAVEELFFAKNTTTAILVAQARGVILMVAHHVGIPVFEYKPNDVKIAVTSYGAADKAQVGAMVKMILGLQSVPKPDDVADACALGICHLFSVR